MLKNRAGKSQASLRSAWYLCGSRAQEPATQPTPAHRHAPIPRSSQAFVKHYFINSFSAQKKIERAKSGCKNSHGLGKQRAPLVANGL